MYNIMKKQMNESYRGQTLLKYYKEDFIGALREYESMEFLQESIHLDKSDQEKLMELLRIGMKKEDLNIMLFNAQNITDEVLENFKKPEGHRIPMILFRDIPLGREEIPSNIQLSVDLMNYSTGGTSKEKSENMNFSNDSILFGRTREDSISETPSESVIRRAREDSISESEPLSPNIQDILENQDQTNFSPDSILFRRTPEDSISETLSESVIRRTREDSISDNIHQEENNTKTVLEEEKLHKSLLERSLYKIKERKLLEEQFQKKLRGLVQKKQERYERNKPSHNYQDQNYRFNQEYVVTLAKFHNIHIPTLASNLTLSDFPRRPRKPAK
jgi:hypothetical protein